MPMGMIENSTITMDKLDALTNVSSYSDFAINVNQTIFSGYLFFILLLTFWIILIIAQSKGEDDLFKSIFSSGITVSIVSLLLRAIYIYNNGIAQGLLTDVQLWVFPIITIIIGMVLYMNK